MAENEKFVTYKWLMVSGLSIVAMCLTLCIFTYSIVGNNIRLKADVVKTESMCSDIAEIKTDQNDMKKAITAIQISIAKIETHMGKGK